MGRRVNTDMSKKCMSNAVSIGAICAMKFELYVDTNDENPVQFTCDLHQIVTHGQEGNT
jgi:hypothetical protein